MPAHPLDGLIQSIHQHETLYNRPSQYIVRTEVFKGKEERWRVRLWARSPTEDDIILWESRRHAVPDDVEGKVAAIKGGYLHISWAEGKGDEEIELSFHAPDEPTSTIKLELAEMFCRDVFDLAMELTSRPAAGGDKSELKALQAEISQKDAEISHLGAKLQSARATAARLSGTEGKKVPLSPQKKAPANASSLQPNQKRRKAVEDEFAGSSDEDG